MPDYEIRLWTSENFDLQALPFVEDAIKLKKWAFAADYARLYVLHKFGGIYLDSDVEVFRPFDEFLDWGFFTSHEVHPFNKTASESSKLDGTGRLHNPKDYVNWIHIQAAIMGAEPGHPFLDLCLKFYDGKRLVSAENKALCDEYIIGPHISKVAERFGYRYEPVRQILKHDMIILEPEVFVGDKHFLTKNAYALHHCAGSWHDRTGQELLVHWMRSRYPVLSPLLVFYLKAYRKIFQGQ